VTEETLRRHLLIALGASPETSRGAACRLGARLDAWAAAGWRDDPATAAALSVPASTLTTARRLLDEPDRKGPPGGCRAIARAELRRAREAGGRIVTLEDAGYPPALRDLDLPPPALWIRGADPGPPERSVAIVGSRRADAYGREAATWFGRELAAAGLTVVSGFARGVDAAAHRGALAGGVDGDPERPATVAVLGTGLGADYPKGHRRLAGEMAERGALVTELPCGVGPKAWHFPVRNRLIAALASATLVVRAAERSGSLITARLALDLGRDVLAVPGRIFEERSRGTNRLIADGAFPALEPRDVLELLGVPEPAKEPAREEGTKRKAGLPGRVLEALVPGDPKSPEALSAELDAPVDQLLGALLELELEGRVRREPGPAFTRRA
jgi:DNA processing protein